MTGNAANPTSSGSACKRPCAYWNLASQGKILRSSIRCQQQSNQKRQGTVQVSCDFPQAHTSLMYRVNLSRPVEIVKGVPPGAQILDGRVGINHFLELTCTLCAAL